MIGPAASADSYRNRLVGLMFRRDLSEVRLVIPNCRSVHTCFMMGPIDLVFIDANGRVTETWEKVKPWRFVNGGSKSRSVIELPAGFVSQSEIEIGDLIEWQ